jgi:hypothetical protein
MPDPDFRKSEKEAVERVGIGLFSRPYLLVSWKRPFLLLARRKFGET